MNHEQAHNPPEMDGLDAEAIAMMKALQAFSQADRESAPEGMEARLLELIGQSQLAPIASALDELGQADRLATPATLQAALPAIAAGATAPTIRLVNEPSRVSVVVENNRAPAVRVREPRWFLAVAASIAVIGATALGLLVLRTPQASTTPSKEIAKINPAPTHTHKLPENTVPAKTLAMEASTDDFDAIAMLDEPLGDVLGDLASEIDVLAADAKALTERVSDTSWRETLGGAL